MLLNAVTENLRLFVGAFFALWLLSDYLKSKFKNYPPGPWGLPILGVAPFMGRRLEKIFTKWAKKYGDVMGFKVGSNYTIVLSSYDAIQEAFVKNAPYFNDRPNNFIFAEALSSKGITPSNYTPEFAAQRKFIHTTLGKLGFGKTTVENYFTEEMDILLKEFGDGEVKLTTAVKKSFKQVVGNVITKVATGQRYESYSDPEFKKFIESIETFFYNAAPVYAASLVFPWFLKLPFLRARARVLKQGMRKATQMSGEKVNEHEKNWNVNNVENLIDEYLLEMKKHEGNGMWSKDFLAHIIRDLVGGGLDTSTLTSIFNILLLANRPEIMKKIHEEIDTVVGVNGNLQFKHREKLPYCHAVIMEMMRYRIVVPLLVPHTAAKDVKFRGYDIPKGATVLANTYAVMNDPQHWDRPEEFIPERHLDEDGNVSISKYFIPFGVGPRTCIGRRLAEVEVFLFSMKIFQRYDIVPIPTPGCRRPHVNDEIVYTGVVGVPPSDTSVKLVPRDV